MTQLYILVIQRREDNSINFNRTWDEYENGFGFLSHEFWLGNEKISYITNQRKYQLRMDITTESGCSFFVTYETFRISDSFSHYKLVSTGEYTGTTDPCIEWCPTNKVLNRCKCEGSCADPTCTESCSSTPTCVCPDGFLMDGEDCVPRENCSCFIEEAENGQGVVLADTLETGSNVIGLLHQTVKHIVQRTPTAFDLLQPAGWTGNPFQVMCDVSDGGGWLVFQRRDDSSLSFHRDWNEYREGFGTADGNFWLGNDKLAALTSQGQYELRIDFVSKSGQQTLC
ncbi:hypothetical protein BSL78_03359 [Apostichopus japonicus]|uniref:Fibrinogen C-terminal domain-containing protein n=1 Tax=Stichopus japonicus TaxID=307972 RepID=A0A2G8LHG4_STIJA|nr:hypothetical protein BSL78_03359 [Apostichopus japonicus]